ncbi:MAG: methionyl-tRNA formyltransferase [Gammaproteobacteria bacterium]
MKTPGLNVAFAGTPDIAATLLAVILEHGRHEVMLIYTQPDRPAGRGRQLTKSPVKVLAGQRRLPVRQPGSPQLFDTAGELGKADVLVVAAYGMILPQAILQRPRLGAVNVHLSLLPRWRGAAPVQRALLAGDDITGITIMQMDAGLDTGPILLQRSCPIHAEDTTGSLTERLARLGGECLISILDALTDGAVEPTAQDRFRASYATKISKEEARIDWSRPAREIERMVRAFNPAPIAHAILNGMQMRIWEAGVIEDKQPGIAPGTTVSISAEGIDVATGNGILRIRRLQLPGKTSVSAREFLSAHACKFTGLALER